MATRAAVRVAARNVLRLIERTGFLDNPRDVRMEAETAAEHAETTALIRRAAAEGSVLLKNEGGLLPLPEGASVAVIGPNAATAQVMGGGSAQINAHRRVSPLEGLRAALGAARVSYALGCYNDKFLPVSAAPVQIEYRAAEGAEVLAQETRPSSEVMWFALPAGVPAQFRARLTSTLTIDEAGQYELSLTSAGRSRLILDGAALIENWERYRPGGSYGGLGSDEVRVRHFLSSGEHAVVVEFASQPEALIPLNAVRLGLRQELPDSSVQDAARLAAEADYAVVCIGTNGDWETEGVDRWGLALPGRQDELVQAVARANPNTIVLLQTGGPVLMPWLSEVRAVLQGWLPGQEAGHALADVLTGRAEPGGRLSQTFPARLEDDPVHPEQPDRQYPGEDGHVEYRECLGIGYRHVDRAGTTPLFPFGHGLSYTTFELGEPQLQARTVEPGETIAVTLPVRNTGGRVGQTVVQLYVRDLEAGVERPHKELKAFAKVALQPGEAREVRLALDMRSLAYFDEARRAWVAEAGDFDLLIGTSSVELPRSVRLRLAREWVEPI